MSICWFLSNLIPKNDCTVLGAQKYHCCWIFQYLPASDTEEEWYGSLLTPSLGAMSRSILVTLLAICTSREPPQMLHLRSRHKPPSMDTCFQSTTCQCFWQITLSLDITICWYSLFVCRYSLPITSFPPPHSLYNIVHQHIQWDLTPSWWR